MDEVSGLLLYACNLISCVALHLVCARLSAACERVGVRERSLQRGDVGSVLARLLQLALHLGYGWRDVRQALLCEGVRSYK